MRNRPSEKLALEQMVDDKLPISDLQRILQPIQVNSSSEDELIDRLEEEGVIDDLMRRVRDAPIGLPEHVQEPCGVLKYIDSQSNKLVNTDIKYLEECLDPCQIYMHTEVINGKLQIDTISDDFQRSTFQIHILFNKQRFSTNPLAVTRNPNFNETFLFYIDHSQHSQVPDVENVLSLQESVIVFLVATDKSGDQQVMSKECFEWRAILEQPQTIKLELKGLLNERDLLIGNLTLRISLIPALKSTISTDVLKTQLTLEKNRNTEKDRLFMTFAKKWWNEFLQTRPDIKERLVKIYASDEKNRSFPVFTYVWPIKISRVLDCPRVAHRFVSSLDCEFVADGGIAGDNDIWHSAAALISGKQGNHASHNALLCSFLTGFGLNAFVALGVKQGKPWSWVVTIDDTISFWDGTTGQRFVHVLADPDTHEVTGLEHPYRTVDCLFNHDSFYANVQVDNRVPLVDFNLTNPRKWKGMDSAAITALHYSRPFDHSPRGIKIRGCEGDPNIQAAAIEATLSTLIEDYRHQHDLGTKWDQELGMMLSSAIHRYEMSELYGISAEAPEFNDALRRAVPNGHTFKALPIRLHSTNPQKIFNTMLKRPMWEPLLRTRGNEARLGIRAKIFHYAEESMAVWVIVAARYAACP